MTALIINDLHIGVNRSAGTTQDSKRKLRAYLQTSLRDLLFSHTDKDGIVNGDLFDAFDVDIYEILFCFYTFADWLHYSGKMLKVGRGNHDISKDDQKLSAFGFLCSLLVKQFPEQVEVIDGGLTELYPNVWMIPHCVNQEQFNTQLEEALCLSPCHLLLHANVDNHFAEQADHSLNVSHEMITRLIDAGHTLVFGHEHHHKRLYQGRVIVTGNQFPSSVYDCLSRGSAQADGVKYAHVLHRVEGEWELEEVPTWNALSDFTELDWHDLSYATRARFIRVGGSATAEQAADVINAIATYRQKSDAFIITNAVDIDSINGMADMHKMSHEQLQQVDVLSALKEHLDPVEQEAVDALLRGRK